MQTEGQIKQQLKQVRFRHLKKRLKTQLRQEPCNCVHNRTLPLPDGKGDEYVSFCGMYAEDRNGADWQGLICDKRYGGFELAKGCPTFEVKHSKEEVKTEFDELLAGDRGALASEYPDIAALSWVLDIKEDEAGDSGEQGDTAADEPVVVSLDWGPVTAELQAELQAGTKRPWWHWRTWFPKSHE